jgi:type I restriction enzyme S subunit
MKTKFKTLGDVCENISRPFDFSHYQRVVFVNTGDVLDGKFLHKDYSEKEGLPGQAKKAIQKEDILFSEIRPINKRFAFVDEDCDEYVVSTKFMVLRSNDDVIPKYLYHYLKCDSTLKNLQREAESRSGTFPQITFDAISYFSIPIPSKKEQERISAFIDNIEKQIELNQQMNETLEEIAKTLFKSWFIDFDPVRAKVERRSTGLSKEISELFPDSFEDSELGQIPMGFKVGKLQEMAKYLNRGVSPTYVENSGVYLVNQKCIRNGQIDFNLCKQSKEKSSMDERYLEKYDILLNSMGVGTLGRVSMFHKFDKKITADALVTIIKGDSVGSSFFIYYFLERMEKYLNTISVGSTGQTSLKKEDILDLQMIIPPKKLLDEFGSQLSIYAEKKYLNTQESLILTDLRDTLLPKLISGELKVSDAESLIEEASI